MNDRAAAHLNILLVFAIQVVVLASLWLVSRLSIYWAIPIGIAVSFLLLTNYVLLHESCHHNLHPDKGKNRALGTLTGFLFPVSFTFMEIAHRVHHNNNRTDYEMFDYYYESDNLVVKYAQWYSILIGIYPPIIPLGSVLMAFAPSVFLAKPFARARSSAVLFANNQYQKPEIGKIRTEVIAGITWWVLMSYILELKLWPCLIVYACFCFNWSTRQYVTHAYTERKVIEGALNLKVSRVMSWILLNSQWDQVHHKFPHVPWTKLPNYADRTMQPISYWRQYWRMWKGPQPNIDPAPQPIQLA